MHKTGLKLKKIISRNDKISPSWHQLKTSDCIYEKYKVKNTAQMHYCYQQNTQISNQNGLSLPSLAKPENLDRHKKAKIDFLPKMQPREKLELSATVLRKKKSVSNGLFQSNLILNSFDYLKNLNGQNGPFDFDG